METKCLYYPAPGTASLLAEIEDRLELLNDIIEEYGQSGKTSLSKRLIMSRIVRSYGYTYEEYQYGVFMS
jgi:hypothetical protein